MVQTSVYAKTVVLFRFTIIPAVNANIPFHQSSQSVQSLLESTTPVQALKHCARLLRRRSQHLPFVFAFATAKAGYVSFIVPTSTYSQICLTVPPDLCFYKVSYTHFLDFLHNFLLLLHFHVHSLSLHNTLTTKNFLPTVVSSPRDIA